MADSALRDRVCAAAAALNLQPTRMQVDALLNYLVLLQRWNAFYNLTSVRDPEDMLRQHLFDCMAIIGPLRRSMGLHRHRVLDAGSGGGLPGAVIAILEERITVTCVDAVGKKTAFVRQVAAELGIANLRGLHTRVERVTEPFDYIVSRAFSALANFTSLTQAALSEGGVWLAMKGKLPADEIAALPVDIAVFHVEQLNVPGLDAERCLVWMKRKQVTS